jgi:hypothetical protein
MNRGKCLLFGQVAVLFGGRDALVKTYAGYTQCERCGVYDSDPRWCDLCMAPKDRNSPVGGRVVAGNGQGNPATGTVGWRPPSAHRALTKDPPEVPQFHNFIVPFSKPGRSTSGTCETVLARELLSTRRPGA